MSNDKISKRNFWNNFVGFGALIGIIFCVFFFNIKIGFTVFENIEVVPSTIITIFVLSFIVAIVIIYFLVIYKIRKEVE